MIGGFTSGLTTWVNQRSQARAAQIAHELSRREDLVRDFIAAASKTYGDAIVNNEPQMQELVNLYAMISRLRVLSMPRTVACADAVMHATVATYFAPNRTVRDLHEMMKDDIGIDPLRELSEVARQELHSLSRL